MRRSLVAAELTVDALADLIYTPAYRRRHPGPYDTLGDPTMPPYARRRHLVASNEHDAWDALPNIIADALILHATDDQLAPYANADLLAGRIRGRRCIRSTGHATPTLRSAANRPARRCWIFCWAAAVSAGPGLQVTKSLLSPPAGIW